MPVSTTGPPNVGRRNWTEGDEPPRFVPVIAKPEMVWPGPPSAGEITSIAGTLPVPLTANVFADDGVALEAPVGVFTTTVRAPGFASFAILTVGVTTVPAGFTLSVPAMAFVSAAVPSRKTTLVAPDRLEPRIVIAVPVVFVLPPAGP